MAAPTRIWCAAWGHVELAIAGDWNARTAHYQHSDSRCSGFLRYSSRDEYIIRSVDTLGVVLFPGVAMPLHLFEPRYRKLLADIREGTKRFGIVCAVPGVDERDLPPGRAGCVAELTQVEILPDGRANIMVVGRERFSLETFVDDPAPYNVADVLPFSDTPSAAPIALVVAADEVASRFQRVVAAVHTLSDDPSPAPTLPDDPSAVPFAIGAMIDLDLESRQALLAERSAAERLTQIDGILRRVLPDLELRAAMHGHGGSA